MGWGGDQQDGRGTEKVRAANMTEVHCMRVWKGRDKTHYKIPRRIEKAEERVKKDW
jgi:hypothetical protein